MFLGFRAHVIAYPEYIGKGNASGGLPGAPPWRPLRGAHLCSSSTPPPKKKADSADKSRTESTSTSIFFSRMTFRNFAKTPASTLIGNSTSLRSTLWCSHYSVAKRQQFSCPLRRHPDFAGEFGQRGSRSLDLFFLVP